MEKIIISTVTELAAALTCQLGFRPSESLVTAGLRRADDRWVVSPPIARMDADGWHESMPVVLDATRRHGAEVIVVVGFDMPADQVAQIIESVQPVLPVMVGGTVLDGTALTLTDGEVVQREPYEFSETNAAATGTLAGTNVVGDRAALFDEWRVGGTADLLTREDVVPVLDSLTRENVAEWADRVAGTVVRAANERTQPLTRAEAAAVLVACQNTKMRDVIWFKGADEGDARGVFDVLRGVVGLTPDEKKAAALVALGAFFAWRSGDGARGLVAADVAADLDPSLTLPALVTALCASGIPPTAWDQFRDEMPWVPPRS